MEIGIAGRDVGARWRGTVVGWGRRVVALGTIASLTLVGGSAVARAASPNAAEPSADVRGQELFDEGSLAYQEGRYADAIVSLTEAYDLLNEPLLLYNIAVCHDRLEHHDEALGYYRRYRRFASESETAELDRRVSSLEQRKAAADEPRPRASPSVDGGGGTPSPALVLDHDSSGERASDDVIARGGDKIFDATAWALAGVTVVGVGVGAGLGGAALRGSGEIESMCGRAEGGPVLCPEPVAADVARVRRLGLGADIALGISGAVAVAFIAVVATRAARRRPRAVARLGPSVGGGALSLRF